MNKIVTGSFLLVSFLIVAGCALIAGKDDESLSASQLPLRLSYIETLRNEDSLRGEAMREIATATLPATTLQRPNSVCADPFRVFAIDTYLSQPTIPGARMFVFDRGERRVKIFGAAGDDVKLIAPGGLAVDAAQTVFISDRQQSRVFGYDRNGRLLMIIGKTGELSMPAGLVVNRRSNRLYVADTHAHQVKVYNTFDGQPTRSADGRPLELGGSKNPAENFKFPAAVALDLSENVYVLDSQRMRVYVYDPDGLFVRMFGLPKAMTSASRKAGGIAVDSDGHVYVTDSGNNTILIFNQDGSFLSTWGKTGGLVGDFWAPAGIFIDDRDTIYIADQTNGRIQVFQYIK